MDRRKFLTLGATTMALCGTVKASSTQPDKVKTDLPTFVNGLKQDSASYARM